MTHTVNYQPIDLDGLTDFGSLELKNTDANENGFYQR